MEVPDGLPGLRPVVGDEAEIAVPRLARDRSRGQEKPTTEPLVVQVRELRDVATRDDEDMQRCALIDVIERHDVLVLIDDRRRNLFRGDLAKNAVGHLRTLAT